jgi:hypothetical protein
MTGGCDTPPTSAIGYTRHAARLLSSLRVIERSQYASPVRTLHCQLVGVSEGMTTISIQVSDPARLTTTGTSVTASAASAWRRFTRLLQTTWCVINGGHYKVLHTEPDRMALRCVACGHTSPGWTVGSPRLARTMPSDPERLRAVRRPMVA